MSLIQKQKKLLSGSWAIALNLRSVNTKSKTHSSETSRKCEINSTTHESNYGNSSSKLSLADFKTELEENIPSVLEN